MLSLFFINANADTLRQNLAQSKARTRTSTTARTGAKNTKQNGQNLAKSKGKARNQDMYGMDSFGSLDSSYMAEQAAQ